MRVRVLSVSPGNECLSPSVAIAYRDLGRHFEILLAFQGICDSQFERLPSDDFFMQATAGMREPLQLYLQDYLDGPEESLHQGVPITAPGTRQEVLPMAAAAAGLLYQLGRHRVGIAIVDSHRCGKVFRYTSNEDVVAREVVQLPLEGAAS